MASISGCAKADEADLVGQLTPVIGVGDEEDTVAELIELHHLKGYLFEYPTGSNWFREFCKAKSSIVGDEEDTVAELIELHHLKGYLFEYPTGSNWFREFCKAKSSIDGIWGHAFAYRGNFFRTCSVSQGGDYLFLLPDLAQEKKCRRLGNEFDYGLALPLRNLAKSVMNWIGACLAQLNCNFWEVILVYKTLNGRWVVSGSARRITAKVFLEYYAMKYATTTDGAYFSSSSSRPCFFDLTSTGRVWNDNLLWVCLQRSDEKPLKLNNRTIAKGTELEAVLKELEISRFKRAASKVDKVRRSQAKRRLAGKTPGSMEVKLSTPELNIPLKLARLNEIPDGPVDVVTVSSTIVRNLGKRKAVKRGAAPRSVTSVSVDDSSKRRKVTSPIKLQEVLEKSDKIAVGADLRPRFEVEASLLEEQCRAKARENKVFVMDDEFKKFARALRDVQLGFQDMSMELEKRISQLEGEKNQLEENLTQEKEAFQLEQEKEREDAALKLKEVKVKGEAEAERLVAAFAISWNNLAGKLYQLRYTKAEIMAFSEGNYEEMEIMDEEEVEEKEDGLNIAEKTAADNQETINQEIKSSHFRVEDLEGLLEVEKKSSAELQYEDRLDDNVKLSLKLEEAERQVEQKTAIILSRDLALNQLTSELAESKEKATSGSRHEAELVEYRIKALNEEISGMKCNICALNE
ncbi:hypothetical protein GIB67_040013 [Kingdonia uniflora]|uniref:Uncharacterized protein n=1 Tax=Kingdonia uniflora TaxID=39325 RepID=A0A7J7MUA4_9MAGN|nr:hypothetical protein GIB67_040013 [Kingdonia uniflora]